MAKRINVGEPFKEVVATTDETQTVLNNEPVESQEARTRGRLTNWTFAGGVTALAVSAGYGAYDGTFNEVSSVWAALGPIAGAIFGYFYRGNRNRETK